MKPVIIAVRPTEGICSSVTKGKKSTMYPPNRMSNMPIIAPIQPNMKTPYLLMLRSLY